MQLNNLFRKSKSLILESEEGVIHIILVVLLILGIILGVYLVQTHTNLLPKAFDSVSDPTVSYPYGKAISLKSDAQSQAVKVNNSETRNPGINFTVEAWIKPEVPTATRNEVRGYVVSKGSLDVGKLPYLLDYYARWNSNGTVDYYYTFDVIGKKANEAACNMMPVQVMGENLGGNFGGLGGSVTPEKAGRWRHIAFVINNGVASFFEDGKLVKRRSDWVFAEMCPNNEPILVGSLNNGPNSFIAGVTGQPNFPGQIDEFRWSNIARYTGDSFTVPTKPFSRDVMGLILYHFDGDLNNDSDVKIPGDSTTYNYSGIFLGSPQYVDSTIVTNSGPSPTTSPATKSAALRLFPKQTAGIGQEVTVTLALSAIEPINLISAQINYPQDKLDVVGLDLGTSVFNNTFEKYYGNGQISIIMGNTGGVKTGDINSGIVVAKLVFKTKAAGVSEITLDPKASKILRVGDGANVLNVDNQTNAVITVSSGPTATPDPTPVATPIGTPGPSVSFRVVPFCKGPGQLVNRIEHKWIAGSWANTIYRNPPYATYGESIDVGWSRDGFTDPYEDNKEIQFNTTYTYKLGTGEGILGPVTVKTPASCDSNIPPAGKILDLSSCDVIKGFACDKTDINKPIMVNFYADALGDNGGISIGSILANKPAWPGTSYNGDFIFSQFCSTGTLIDPMPPVFFEFPVPYSIKDGKTHKIYATAVNNPAGYNKPLNSPIYIGDLTGTANNLTCAKPPTPPPTSPPNPTPIASSTTPSPSLPPACGQFCTTSTDCQYSKFGCTACLPNASGGGSSCQPPVQACALTKAEWVLTANPAQSNTSAGLRVEATGDCSNQQVSFTVNEDDGVLGSDPVKTNPQSVVLIANSSQNNFVGKSTWVTEFQEDGIFGSSSPPEYQFIAQIVGKKDSVTSANPELQVLRTAGTPSPVVGELNGRVNEETGKSPDLDDLSWLLEKWGPIKNELVDYNKDGVINNFDVAAEVAILKQLGILRSTSSQ